MKLEKPIDIPLSLYIHIPWCIKKCPYCDFNSYRRQEHFPEAEYTSALLKDLSESLTHVHGRKLKSIFIGGGTPSLFSGKSIQTILEGANRLIPFEETIEITLEANPGTIERDSFLEYKKAGVTRISLGAQSFNNRHLDALGRIHAADNILKSVELIHQANFKSFNLDIMYALPNQTVDEAMQDLTTAISLKPYHLSWYHLTLEPNTPFYHTPPSIPDEETSWDIQQAGFEKLAQAGFHHYEISAFAQPNHTCFHNLNYWRFGDYIGIGAGAHGKVTTDTGQVERHHKQRNPKAYLDTQKSFVLEKKFVSETDLLFEFFLNHCRLHEVIPLERFESRTGLPRTAIDKPLNAACKKGFMKTNGQTLTITPLGRRFTNDLMSLFLDDIT